MAIHIVDLVYSWICCLCRLDNFLIELFYEFAVMHDLRMIHTDLKPENILLLSPEYVKVPDYKVFFVSMHILFCFRLRAPFCSWNCLHY